MLFFHLLRNQCNTYSVAHCTTFPPENTSQQKTSRSPNLAPTCVSQTTSDVTCCATVCFSGRFFSARQTKDRARASELSGDLTVVHENVEQAAGETMSRRVTMDPGLEWREKKIKQPLPEPVGESVPEPHSGYVTQKACEWMHNLSLVLQKANSVYNMAV